jgi:regulator of protease activity HflC (stomatin/prohibitin superfamily)
MPTYNQSRNQTGPLSIVAGAVIVLLLVGVFNSIAIIQPGTVGVVIRLGEAQPTPLAEGIHFVLPFLSQVQELNVKIQKAEVKTDAASKDLQTVQAAIVVNYRIDKTKAVVLFREIGMAYLETVIEPAIQKAFKAGSAKYTAEELITERSTVSMGIRESISERLEQFGVIVDAVNITQFDFSEEFNKAIEAKVTAVQKSLQAEKELERYRFEAQQKVETAKGEAEAIMETAKAEAEALGLKKEYATRDLIWLTAVEKWDGTLPTHLFATPPIPVFETGK